MTAKQIGDVILSTANPNVTSLTGYTVLLQNGSALSEDKFLNILYFDGKPRTPEDQMADCLDYLKRFRTKYYEDYAECPIYAYYNVPMEAVIGQGVLDAGKAVDGPGALNARRMEKSDISSDYTVKGKSAFQALYAVDTAGYDSTWANDIKEVRVGLLAADSSEEDLKTRYNFYTENWLEREKHGYDGNIVGAGFVKEYIDFYNDNAHASGLINLPVGLLKTGEGTLTLSGNNTYQGASIAKQGTLSIDGSVAGDAYSIEKGTIAGRGTIHGTLYNQNIAIA
ncbi:MAG: autotransporter-associated beta strand repeat-containing protein, partial [Acidaminococcaceae bacterium]|nr:autotransporter-associated beta strand repeat-containing protein [Acidaminococcaceae bacterium]